MTYWAHSDPNGLPPNHAEAKWQTIAEHLRNVGVLSAGLATAARPGDESFARSAELAGHLHDFGKYSECFQQMISTGEGRCQHSAHGAAIANATRNPDVAFAIAGHHAGIPDKAGGTGTLQTRIRGAAIEADALCDRALGDAPFLETCFRNSGLPWTVPNENFDLHTRILFSCLIDADRLDSAGRAPSSPLLSSDRWLAKLMAHIEGLSEQTTEATVRLARRAVLDDCINAASYPERLLSLTVPTGGGKTLAAMAFALQRAALLPDAYRRIIVVIPYLSIIEQNAEVYAKIFGTDAVLEHHSGSFERLIRGADDNYLPDSSQNDETRSMSVVIQPATENWDAPIIVTTSVRFFESLFSNRPSDLRRVHNIARSVVVLDEVQTLPRRLLAPLLSMIRELSTNWGCTFVFSTATQPAFQKHPTSLPKDVRWPTGTVREIVRKPEKLQKDLRRVNIEWELDTTITWPELAVRILRQPQALCVVNLREHASVLFDELASLAGVSRADEIVHLSTRMCAAHRLRVLDRIKRRLKEGLPCRVISTQLIEAGVDLDFPSAFRALGPLDAILQVAGRADRNGILTGSAGRPAGRLVVFRPEDERTPPNEYKEATGLTGSMARSAIGNGDSIQPDSLDQMEKYWDRYYSETDDLGQPLQDLRQRGMFATIAQQFEMINSRTRDVFVPYDDTSRNAIDELRKKGVLTKELRRKLQRYVVGLLPTEVAAAAGILEKIGKEGVIWVAVDKAYTETKGLKLMLNEEDTMI